MSKDDGGALVNVNPELVSKKAPELADTVSLETQFELLVRRWQSDSSSIYISLLLNACAWAEGPSKYLVPSKICGMSCANTWCSVLEVGP